MQTDKAPKGRSPAAPMPRFTLTIDEFCEATGMGRSLAYQQMQKGGLPFVKIGKRRLIPVDESRAWLKGKEVTNSSDT